MEKKREGEGVEGEGVEEGDGVEEREGGGASWHALDDEFNSYLVNE